MRALILKIFKIVINQQFIFFMSQGTYIAVLFDWLNYVQLKSGSEPLVSFVYRILRSLSDMRLIG